MDTPFLPFYYLLREYGVPVSPTDMLEMRRGMDDGIVENLDDFYVFARLNCVRRVEHMDAFERAFAFYFLGIDIPAVAEGDMALFHTRQFKEWLKEQVKKGELPRSVMWDMSPEELMKKFWDTVREQMEAHHGGSRWVGTGGTSPFGHSGFARRGVRVHGESRRRSAIKVIGERRYVDYSSASTLRQENLRQALETMRHMKKEGVPDTLAIDETIRTTAKNGGEIELVFEPDLRDRMSLVLLIDNGGYSMSPYARLTQLLFQKIHGRFKDLQTYFFHNTIYGCVWSDVRRRVPHDTKKLLARKPDTRLVIVGDASMAPEELEMPGGAITYGQQDSESSAVWLKRISRRFPRVCWLNPVPREIWEYGQFYTLQRIRKYFHMEDMTLGGIKRMVEFLGEH